MSEDKKPREFWIRMPEGMFVNKEHFITDVMTRKHSDKDTHVIEYSAYQFLEQKLALAVEALEEIAKYKDTRTDLVVFTIRNFANDTLSKIKGDGNE